MAICVFIVRQSQMKEQANALTIALLRSATNGLNKIKFDVSRLLNSSEHFPSLRSNQSNSNQYENIRRFLP